MKLLLVFQLIFKFLYLSLQKANIWIAVRQIKCLISLAKAGSEWLRIYILPWNSLALKSPFISWSLFVQVRFLWCDCGKTTTTGSNYTLDGNVSLEIVILKVGLLFNLQFCKAGSSLISSFWNPF